jgi:hypothetical protein
MLELDPSVENSAALLDAYSAVAESAIRFEGDRPLREALGDGDV